MFLESRIRRAIDHRVDVRNYECLRHRNCVNIYDFQIHHLFSLFTNSSRGPPRPIVSAPLFSASEFRMQMGKTQVQYVTRMHPIQKIMGAKRFFFSTRVVSMPILSRTLWLSTLRNRGFSPSLIRRATKKNFVK